MPRIQEEEGDPRTARQVVISALIGAYVWRGDEFAGQILNEIATNAGKAPEIAGLIPFLIRGAMSHGDINDKEQAVIRRRAINLFANITDVCCREFRIGSAGAR